MLSYLKHIIIAAACIIHSATAEGGQEVPLFNGKDFTGWEFHNEAEKDWWRIENGTLIGGSLTKHQTQTKFLHSTKIYKNFILKFKVKLVKASGKANSGVQIRSLVRIVVP